jgi:hypothetical protein
MNIKKTQVTNTAEIISYNERQKHKISLSDSPIRNDITTEVFTPPCVQIVVFW